MQLFHRNWIHSATLKNPDGAKEQVSQPMWKGYLSHMQTAKAEASLGIRAVSPGPLLFTHKPEPQEASDKELCRCIWRINAWH